MTTVTVSEQDGIPFLLQSRLAGSAGPSGESSVSDSQQSPQAMLFKSFPTSLGGMERDKPVTSRRSDESDEEDTARLHQSILQKVQSLRSGLGALREAEAGVTDTCTDNDDQAVAVAWFRIAAEQGIAEAEWSLGALYMGGIGVERTEAVGVAWYTRAALQGHVAAQTALATSYMEGVGKSPEVLQCVWSRSAHLIYFAVFRSGPKQDRCRRVVFASCCTAARRVHVVRIHPAHRAASPQPLPGCRGYWHEALDITAGQDSWSVLRGRPRCSSRYGIGA